MRKLMVGDSRRRIALAPLTCVLLALVLPAGAARPALAQMSCDPCAVGVVFDGPWEGNDELRTGLEEEIAALAAPRFTVVFPAGARRGADWTLEGAREAVEALLADADIDIVVTSGPVSSSHAITRGGLPKPVVATFVLDPEAQDFPLETTAAGERVSGVPNLSYITFAGDRTDEIRRLREVAPFRRLTYLANEALLAAVPGLETNLRRLAQEGGVEATIVRVGTSVDAALAALLPGTEAVYVTPMTQLPAGELDRLVRALIERRVPAFSYWGRSEVELGLLASLYLDTDMRRLDRRVALHVQRILAGEDAGALPVDFRRNRRLTLNMATARAIGVHPDWRVMTEAEVLRAEPPNVTRRLSLLSAAREAVAANLDLAAADRSVAAGRQVARAARAALRPQIAASGGAETIDRDRAESSFGLQPVWTSAGSVGVSQLLFSDGARARATIERHVQTSREQVREELRLDVAHGAAVGYLDVLRARTFERIQRENLTLTRSNLELAQSRRRIGVARASEVIRWENQIAINRRAVIDAGAARSVAEIALNRWLNRPLEEPFETAEVDLDDPALLANAAVVDVYVDNPFAFAIFRDFMTAEALAQSPELRQLDAAIAAQARTALAARRALWAPTVSAGGDLTVLQTAGGLDAVDPADLPFPITQPNPFNWSVGVSASLPLFTGGARRAERTRAAEELDELRLTRRAAAERVEQRLRSVLHRAGASYAGIDLAADAADAARRNLALITDAYEQGVLSILDLIDAQNAALVAEESAATAVYDYLIDLMDTHRASGRFGLFMEAAELAAFTDRMRAFFRDAGYEPRAPGP